MKPYASLFSRSVGRNYLSILKQMRPPSRLTPDTRPATLCTAHFGDLQFVHSMTLKDGEAAEVTQKNILMWAEFTWRVGLGGI